MRAAPFNFSENTVEKPCKNVVSTEFLPVALDAVPVNISKGDYSNLKHLNKRNGTTVLKN